jgi:DNA modification methylase
MSNKYQNKSKKIILQNNENELEEKKILCVLKDKSLNEFIETKKDEVNLNVKKVLKEKIKQKKDTENKLINKKKVLNKQKNEIESDIESDTKSDTESEIESEIESDIENEIVNKVLKKKINKQKSNNIDDENIISDNVKLYIGDSLTLSENFNNKFDLIYMDPPYDTNRNFTLNSKDDKTGFNDKWDEKTYEEWVEKLIKKLKNTLTNKGTLVYHISSENSYVVEKVLQNNFKNIEKIYWKRCHGKNTVKNKFGAIIDILFACNNGKNIFNMQTIKIEDDSVWAFKNKDSRGMYSLGALKHDRTRKGNEYTIIHDDVEYKNEYGWKLNKTEVEKLIKDDRIHFVSNKHNMYVKIYKHEHKGKPLSNLWDDIHSITRTQKDPRLYPTQKPQKLLERIIKIYSNNDSYILDPVCGSGTTGFVADKMNRKCIMFDLNKDVKKLIKTRFNDKIYNI